MSQLRLGKPQKALIAIIETEGGQILSTNKESQLPHCRP
jgi:hypothetical protein